MLMPVAPDGFGRKDRVPGRIVNFVAEVLAGPQGAIPSRAHSQVNSPRIQALRETGDKEGPSQ